jgi:hypothetical protein
MPRIYRPKSLSDRFESKYIPEPMSGCWIWIGQTNEAGYGLIKDFGSKNVRCLERAHRVAWRLYKKDPIGNLILCHKCDTPSCVNPDHLFLGTHLDNVLDCRKKGRGYHPPLTIKCPKGHDYSVHGRLQYKDGKLKRKECLICKKEQHRKAYLKYKNSDAYQKSLKRNKVRDSV